MKQPVQDITALRLLRFTIFYFIAFWSACCSFSVIFSLRATMLINLNLNYICNRSLHILQEFRKCGLIIGKL